MQFINIFKAKEKKSPNSPDYNLSYYDKETKTSTDVGGGWIKQGQSGAFISVQFKKPYNGNPGYELKPYGSAPVQTDGLGEVRAKVLEANPQDADIKPEDIPF